MISQIVSIVLVLGVVIYFLRKEHQKEKKYFGKKVALTTKEKRILEKYKKEYEPIKSDERLARLERDQWELEDIAKTSTEIVYDSPIPSKQERQTLQTGDLVKLIFIFDGDDEAERIWVKVVEKKDGLFLGELDNEAFDDILSSVKNVWFHPNHVFSIDRQETSS